MTDKSHAEARNERRQGWLESTTAASINRPRLTVFLWLLAGVVAGYGVATIPVDTTTSSFLNRSGPDWVAYRESVQIFGNDEFISVLVRGSKRYDHETLRTVFSLSQRLEAVSQVRRVDSISTVPLIVLDENGSLYTDPAMVRIPLNAQDSAVIEQLMESDVSQRRRLVSSDGKSFVVDIFLEEESDKRFEVAVEEIQRITSEYDVAISGVPIFRTAVNSKTGEELFRFVPVTLFLVCVVLWFGFRDLTAVFTAMVSAGCGTWIGIGIMGAFGTPLSLSTVTLPSIFLALGCAYNVHVLRAASVSSSRRTLEIEVASVCRPLGYSGLTTSIGFLSMGIVPIQAIRDLAEYGAIGVLVVLFSALTLAPALLSMFPHRKRDGPSPTAVMGTFARRCLHRLRDWRREVVGLWILVAGCSVFGILQVSIDTDIIRWFPAGSDIRSDYDEIRDAFSGITPLRVVVKSTDSDALTEPDKFKSIEAFTRFLQSEPAIGSVFSVTMSVAQMRRVFSGEDSEHLPESRSEIEQYLALVALDQRTRDLASDDRSVVNIPLRVNVNGSGEVLGVSRRILDWWNRNALDGLSARVTGIMYEFARSEDAIARGQIWGLGVAFGVIGVLLTLILGSPLLAVVALIPNVFPIAIVYGVMGLSGIDVDAGTVCLGSIALGIAVDDTIHVALGYRDELRMGGDPSAAIERVVERVSGALIVTTVAIVFGFLALAMSEFTLIRSFGALTAAVVLMCLVADLTILPVLLVFTTRLFSRDQRR